MQDFDTTDFNILDLLQLDSTITVKEISERVDLSSNACWNRIRRFEENGIIRGRVVLLDPSKFGLKTVVFVSIKAAEHSVAWNTKFKDAISSMPEVIEFYRMAGEVDYLVKMLVSSLEHYDQVYHRLIEVVKMSDISAAFSMQELKNVTCIPLPRPHPARFAEPRE